MDFAVNDEGWPLAPAGYELAQEVGQGAFARVFKAFCPSRDAWVAVKVMALENITTSLEEIQAEVRTMKLSRHENVLDLHACFCVASDLWLVMPLMDKGSCYYVLRVLRKAGRVPEGGGLAEEALATILREVLQGLEYIHGQHQVHRDIKAGNILLNAAGRVAIADFGVAGWLSEAGARSEGERRTFVGTPCWMAPEVMEQQRGYNEKADIWSLGITALELAKGYAPYAKYAPMQVLIKTIREPPPSLRSYVDPPGVALPPLSDRFAKFVARCLQKDPRQRPSAHELLSDPFIKKGAAKVTRLVETLLGDAIPEVGARDAAGKAVDGGHAPISLSNKGASMVPGTTWVFPDDLRAAPGDGGGGGGPSPSALGGGGDGAPGLTGGPAGGRGAGGGDAGAAATGLAGGGAGGGHEEGKDGQLDINELGDALAELGGEGLGGDA